MAAVIGGIGISHTPSMGVEYDRGMASPDGFSARWRPWYDGTRRVAELLGLLAPDHLVVVYNDHLNYFDLDNYPALAIGVGDRFRQADEGWGTRDLPDLAGATYSPGCPATWTSSPRSRCASTCGWAAPRRPS